MHYTAVYYTTLLRLRLGAGMESAGTPLPLPVAGIHWLLRADIQKGFEAEFISGSSGDLGCVLVSST